MLNFISTELEGAKIVQIEPRVDGRGLFSRVFCKEIFKEQIGRNIEVKQINISRTVSRGAIRGLHYQIPPYSEDKLVRCVTGAIFDVIVDIRPQSNTYMQWASFELRGENLKMLFIPQGFAHGFQTLTREVELMYIHTNCYSKDHERGINYCDPAFNINWPLDVSVMSDRDKSFPFIDACFKGVEL